MDKLLISVLSLVLSAVGCAPGLDAATVLGQAPAMAVGLPGNFVAVTPAEPGARVRVRCGGSYLGSDEFGTPVTKLVTVYPVPPTCVMEVKTDAGWQEVK